MLYAVICYNNEDEVFAWSKEHDAEVMARLKAVQEKWVISGKLKPSLRLMPTSTATTFRKSENVILDGPFAETKEQLLGFYIVDVADLDEALGFVKELAVANPGGSYELRPILSYFANSAVETA
jgi:hypothetical protein